MILSHLVQIDTIHTTIKQVLKTELEISEHLIKKLKYADKIYCNKQLVHINEHVEPGDFIEVLIDFEEDQDLILPENIEIDVLYEDDYLIALNKQPGIVVHPTFNHPTGTIANALSYYYKSKGILKKIRPVSRLDKDTSGLILFAKNEYIQSALINQMRRKTFIKEYIGIVHGIINTRIGQINLPISRKIDSLILREVSPEGEKAITNYQVISYFNDYTLVKFKLETGRTHQIRVHCQAISHPLVGETLYSELPTNLINRQALHSLKVKIVHPLTKKSLEITAPLQDDMVNLIKTLSSLQ